MEHRQGAASNRSKRARTRERLLRSAFELVMESGFAEVTMDQVASHAGMTKGAIYGNFEDKEDLMLAMVLANSRHVGDEVEFGDSLRAYLRNLGRQVAAVTAQPTGTVTFHAYAATNPQMIRRLTDHFAQRFKLREAELSEAFPNDPLPLPAGQFAAVVQAVAMGVMYQRLLSRDLVADETIVSAFEALASMRGVGWRST
jgi:AcrR family transcriptional regulator